MSNRNSEEGTRALVKENAARAFASHELTVRLDAPPFRSWRCGRPDSGFYGFSVTVEPGHVILTGDLGAMVLRVHEEPPRDKLDWLRSALRDPRYVASKVPQGFETERFDPEAACAWIDAQLDPVEGPGKLKGGAYPFALKAVAREQGEHAFFQALHALGYAPDDAPPCRSLTAQFFWQLEALGWFLRAPGGGVP